MAERARVTAVIEDLFPLYMRRPSIMPAAWQSDIAPAARGQTALARIVADYVAGMTDRFALQSHDRPDGRRSHPAAAPALGAGARRARHPAGAPRLPRHGASRRTQARASCGGACGRIRRGRSRLRSTRRVSLRWACARRGAHALRSPGPRRTSLPMSERCAGRADGDDAGWGGAQGAWAVRTGPRAQGGGRRAGRRPAVDRAARSVLSGARRSRHARPR